MKHDSRAGLVVKACILILIFLHAPQVYAAEESNPTSAKVNVDSSATISNFSITPNYIQVDAPQYIRFGVTVDNIGASDITAMPYVNITDSSGSSIANITFTPFPVGSGFSAWTSDESFHTGNLTVGCYNATAGAWWYVGNSTSELTGEFCIQSAGGSPPGGGGGGGGAPPPLEPPVTPPSIKFAKMPVLVEVRPGTTVIESILVKNPSEIDVAELAVEVSGIPAGWIDITPSAVSLPAGESEALNAVIAVPLGAWPGDYKVTVALAGETSAESFFILRIKSYPSGYERPSITRGVDIDRGESVTRVSIKVENSGKFIELLEVTDDIPKTLAPTADDITSISPKAEIVKRDPVLKWRLRDMAPYETRIISYEVSRVLDEYSPYVYWPVGQVNIFYTMKKPLAEPIRIEEMSAPTLRPGRAGDISVTLMNFETGPVDMSARFELPEGWKVEPDRVADVFPPRTEITFVFSVTPPPDTRPGTYIVTFRVFYNDGRESSKDSTLFVTQSIWEEITGNPVALLRRSLGKLLALAIVALAILSALFHIRRKRRKRYKREGMSAVRGIKERIGLE